MKRTSISRVASAAIVVVAISAGATPGMAQTRSARDTATAYGARLTAKGVPANLNQNRVNNRIDSRIENRLALRIERYRIDSSNNPVAAYQAAPDDKSRTAAKLPPGQQQAAQPYDEQADTRQ